MSDATQPAGQPNPGGTPPVGEAQAKTHRSRLVDHFKRVYQIVVGLAITEGVKHLSAAFTLIWPLKAPIWMFATFLVTVVPIFHGGDRSLDLKYLEKPQLTPKKRFWYIWDVYMLVITATFFVGIAEQIPDKSDVTVGGAASFYLAMGAMLIFDILVLCIDYVKTPGPERAKLAPYGAWILVNLVLGAVCGALGYAAWLNKSAQYFALFGWTLPFELNTVAAIVFAFALGRTIWDYVFGAKFLFP